MSSQTCGKPTRVVGMTHAPCTLPADHGTLHCQHELDELGCHCHLAPEHGACKACLIAAAHEESAAGVEQCEHGGVRFGCQACNEGLPRQEVKLRRALAVRLIAGMDALPRRAL